jgi:hypothetical protein
MTLAGPGPPEEVAPETARAAERLKDGQRPPPFEDVDATRVEQVRAGERSRDTRHRQEPDGPRHYLEVGGSIVRLAGGLPPISSSPRDASACDWTDGTDGRFSSVAVGRSGWCGEMSPNRCRRTAPPGYVRSTHGRGVTEITARCALASTQGADAWEPRTLSSLEVIRWRRGRGSGRLASGAPRGARPHREPPFQRPARWRGARDERREDDGHGIHSTKTSTTLRGSTRCSRCPLPATSSSCLMADGPTRSTPSTHSGWQHRVLNRRHPVEAAPHRR